MSHRNMFRTWHGEERALDPRALDAFRMALQGNVRTPGDAGYDEARAVWNGTIDRHPALIVSAQTIENVQQGIVFAQQHEIVLAVRGGGHSFAGHSTCDGGIMLDLALMRHLRVDPARRLAMAGPGLRWADLDAATQQHGLAVTGGQISHTGIAGLTLGGGMGWLARQVGLTIDHLVSADIVTADGTLRRAAPDADVDLYWAIRGGGGNFGVATSFTYRLQPVGPEVSVYQLAFPVEVAAQLFPEAEKLLEAGPPSLSATFAFLTTPEGMPVAALTLVSTASSELTAQSFAPFRGLGTPVFEETVRVPYSALQRMLDQVAAPELRYYGRGNSLDTLDPLVIEPLATAYAEAPSPQSLVLFVRLSGAVTAIPMEATAFAHRNRPWAVTALAIWRDPADDDTNRTWIERAWSALPALPKAVYVNELGDEGNERVRAAYGPNYERLSQLKRRYDPNNLFRLNQNIRPA
ncbi:FAD-binding oxidoreductase [Thermomicrobium sp.]|uniref:FAD-binding oxidoreductase n=1 Tax=Thermomicrobium sp. TaxID=1969469 RepID=UPI001B002990|nr:FAD-binding oxidoreductase [Thermomicrobium sp.]MBO9306187.1 FAD-binding oxidoreductase [Thermomicrobium sp.]